MKKVLVSRVTYAENWPLSFPFMVGVMAHEYGHLMGISHELYDTDRDTVNEANNSAGIGYWGVMGHGGFGWLHESHFDGPNPMSAWSRRHVEWSTPETVAADMSNVEIPAVNPSESKVLRIPVLESESEYFLVANRQNTHSETGVGSYYDDYAPASGLAIWHVDEDVKNNNNELHKRVDLECADGLFSDKGYDPDNIPSLPNSVSGADNLDYLSTPSYRRAYNGNFGDATDLWDGVDYTAFTPSTNPSTAGYAVVFPDPNDPEKELTEQRVRTGIAVHNIIQALVRWGHAGRHLP